MNFSAGINSGNEGLFWLSEIKKAYPSIQVVLFTAYADIDLAVRGIKEGATDFVVKPWDNAKLLETLQAATKSARPIIKAVPATSSWYPRKAVCSGETATPCSNYGC